MYITTNASLYQQLLAKIKRHTNLEIYLSEKDFEDVKAEAVRNYYDNNGPYVEEGRTMFNVNGYDAVFHLDENTEDHYHGELI